MKVNKTRKIIALLVTISLLVTFVGCSYSDDATPLRPQEEASVINPERGQAQEPESVESTAQTSPDKTNSKGNNLELHFLDVGQGDSIYISLPTGECILVDCGDIGCGQTVIDYLKQANVERIDYLIATHPFSALDVHDMHLHNIFRKTRTRKDGYFASALN